MSRLSVLAILLILVAGGLSLPSSASSKVKILPYKIWKQKKVDEARSLVAELKHETKKITQVKGDETQEEEKQGLVEKLGQAELNLALAKDLSANDYFLLYVAPQFKSNNEAFIQAAKTLSARDMADILSAYQKRLQSADMMTSADSAPSAPTQEAPSPEKTAKAP